MKPPEWHPIETIPKPYREGGSIKIITVWAYYPKTRGTRYHGWMKGHVLWQEDSFRLECIEHGCYRTIPLDHLSAWMPEPTEPKGAVSPWEKKIADIKKELSLETCL